MKKVSLIFYLLLAISTATIAQNKQGQIATQTQSAIQIVSRKEFIDKANELAALLSGKEIEKANIKWKDIKRMMKQEIRNTESLYIASDDPVKKEKYKRIITEQVNHARASTELQTNMTANSMQLHSKLEAFAATITQ